MVPRLSAIAILACAWAGAQAGSTVNQLAESVLAALRAGQTDAQVAQSLHKVKLAERLDDRTIEELESAGAGPKTLAELSRLEWMATGLQAPEGPPAVFPAAERPSAGEQELIVAETRKNALTYSESLPDFICREVVKRYEGGDFAKPGMLKDTLTVQLTYFQQKENYELKLVNNRPTSLTYREAGGLVSEGEFGSMLHLILEPSVKAGFRWDHWTTLRGHAAHVFAFEVDAARSRYYVEVQLQSGPLVMAVVGQRGWIYVDRDTHMVLKIVADAEGFPRNFPVQKERSAVEYDYAEVGGRPFLLPLRAYARMETGGLYTRNEVEFQAYRKFEGEARISFEAAEPVKK